MCLFHRVPCPSLQVIDRFELSWFFCFPDRSLKDTRVYPLDHTSGLSQGLGELFDSGRSCDLTVVVRSPGGVPKEERICLHSVVLSLLLSPPTLTLTASQESKSISMEVPPNCRPCVSKLLRQESFLRILTHTGHERLKAHLHHI